MEVNRGGDTLYPLNPVAATLSTLRPQ